MFPLLEKIMHYQFQEYDFPDRMALSEGLYVIYLQDWLDVFPKEQFLFIKSEDYFKDRYTTIRDIQSFLNIGKHKCLYKFVNAEYNIT